MEGTFRPSATLMIDQLAMFTMDLAVVVILLITSLFLKEERIMLIVFGLLYLFFSLSWHFYDKIVLFFDTPILIA